MKTAQQWFDYWQASASTDLTAFIGEIQSDASKSWAQWCLEELELHWGHDIVRSIARRISTQFGIPYSTEPFHPERLHPGATRPAAPQTLKSQEEPDPKMFGLNDAYWKSVPQAAPPGSSAPPNPPTTDSESGAAGATEEARPTPPWERSLDLLRQETLEGIRRLRSEVASLGCDAWKMESQVEALEKQAKELGERLNLALKLALPKDVKPEAPETLPRIELAPGYSLEFRQHSGLPVRGALLDWDGSKWLVSW